MSAAAATAAAAGAGSPAVRPADAAFTERLLPAAVPLRLPGSSLGGAPVARRSAVGRRKQRRRDNDARLIAASYAGLPGGSLLAGGGGGGAGAGPSSFRAQQEALRLSATFPIPEYTSNFEALFENADLFR